MQTEMEHLSLRYTSLFSAFIGEFAKHALVLPVWLNALFGAAITKPYIRALKLLSKLKAGIYRLPRKRTSKRASTPKPPVFIPPDRPKTSRWMWLARILPTVIAPATATYRAELQQLLSEPAMAAVFVQAPALRRHLRPLCRALGVTLPGDPKPPPDPEPAPVTPRRRPQPGESFIHGRDPTPEWYHLPLQLPLKNAF